MKKIIAIILAFVSLLGVSSCGPVQSKNLLNSEKPVGITAWTYYNGAQMEAFETLLTKFNSTVGTEKGIVVEHSSQGGVNDLAQEVLNACAGKVGAQERPNLAMLYPDTAYTLAGMDALADLDGYFTQDELAQYIPAFIAEGRLEEKGPLYIFPVAKSTEVLLVNRTDWDVFAQATGAEFSELETVEGVAEVAGKYYEWTDAQTPEAPDDGKALFGRDSLDNYMVVGAAQLGNDFTPAKDGAAFPVSKEVMRTLWDNYYVPLVKGHFTAQGKFRSDDMKTGTILAYVGSTSSASYFPDKVTRSDDSSYPITAAVLPAPYFKDSVKKYFPQQGAGFSVIKESESADYACAEFLKWFTQEEQNLEFSVGSSYMPVAIEANDGVKIDSALTKAPDITREVLKWGAQTVKEGNLYVMRPFSGSAEVRKLLRSTLEEAVASAQAEVAAQKERQTGIQKVCADTYFDAWYQTVSQGYIAALQKKAD